MPPNIMALNSKGIYMMCIKGMIPSMTHSKYTDKSIIHANPLLNETFNLLYLLLIVLYKNVIIIFSVYLFILQDITLFNYAPQLRLLSLNHL